MVSGIVEKRQVHRRHANEVRQKQDNRKMITGKVMGAGWTMWTWKQVDVNRRTDGEGGYSISVSELTFFGVIGNSNYFANLKFQIQFQFRLF